VQVSQPQGKTPGFVELGVGQQTMAGVPESGLISPGRLKPLTKLMSYQSNLPAEHMLISNSVELHPCCGCSLALIATGSYPCVQGKYITKLLPDVTVVCIPEAL
jgi:hypothetical protein